MHSPPTTDGSGSMLRIIDNCRNGITEIWILKERESVLSEYSKRFDGRLLVCLGGKKINIARAWTLENLLNEFYKIRDINTEDDSMVCGSGAPCTYWRVKTAQASFPRRL
jgi:hypothetical protein